MKRFHIRHSRVCGNPINNIFKWIPAFAGMTIVFSFLLFILPGNVLAATISLSPSSGTFNQSCNFSLEVVVDAQGAQTDGTDAILFYDPARVTAQSITNGSIYPDYPGNNIDGATGKITISGLASVSTPFSGKGTLATINFTVQSAAPAGATQIKFDFDPNNKAKTTDSNVVERGTVVDVLNSVIDGNFTIGTGSCASQATTLPGTSQVGRGGTGDATPAAQTTQQTTITSSGLPPAGSPELTFTITIVGGILTVLGILGLALL